jgi:hypothetical protein
MKSLAVFIIMTAVIVPIHCFAATALDGYVSVAAARRSLRGPGFSSSEPHLRVFRADVPRGSRSGHAKNLVAIAVEHGDPKTIIMLELVVRLAQRTKSRWIRFWASARSIQMRLQAPIRHLRFFADWAVKKWPLRSNLSGWQVTVRCLDDGSAEHSLQRPVERQLRLRGSHRPQRL